MAQQNSVHRLAVTTVGIEAVTYGTAAASPQQVRPIGESFADERTQDELEVDDESVYLFDHKPTILGNKQGGCSWEQYLQPPAAQLLAAASGPDLVTPPAMLLAKALFGGENVAAGSAVVTASGAPCTAITVTTGHGVRFAVGSSILVAVAGVLYPTFVASVATDVLTLGLELPAAPAAGQLVINMFNYYPTDANTQSLTVNRAIVGDANEQYQWLGCTGDLELTYDRGQLLKLKPSLRAGDWSTGALGQSTAFVADPQGSAFALRNATTLLQPVADTTRVQYPISTLGVKLGLGMVHHDEHGGVNGHAGVMRVGDRMFAELSLKIRADRQLITWQQAKTPLRFFHAIPQGSGVTARYVVLHMPRAFLKGEPKPVSEGGRRLYEVTLCSMIDTTGASALARMPFGLALG